MQVLVPYFVAVIRLVENGAESKWIAIFWTSGRPKKTKKIVCRVSCLNG